MKLISITDGIEKVYVSSEHIQFRSKEECLKFMNNFKLLLEVWHLDKIIQLIDDEDNDKCQ